jgi:hypothetical protein
VTSCMPLVVVPHWAPRCGECALHKLERAGKPQRKRAWSACCNHLPRTNHSSKGKIMSQQRQQRQNARTERSGAGQTAGGNTPGPRAVGGKTPVGKTPDGHTPPDDNYARDRFMGEGLDANKKATDPKKLDPKKASDPKKVAVDPDKGPDGSIAQEVRSEARGGGFDSQRTYADADYGRDEEAHRDAHAGYGRDAFGGRGERKEDASSERPDDKPRYPAQITRDRWNEASPEGARKDQDDATASDADELPQRTLDTSAGGIGQHETAWQGNVGPMGVTERRYGQYGDGTSDAYRSGDASGYEGFRESRTGAEPEPVKEPAPTPANQRAARPGQPAVPPRRG